VVPLAGLYASNNGKSLWSLPGVEPQFIEYQARALITKHLRYPSCHLRLLSRPGLCVSVFQIPCIISFITSVYTLSYHLPRGDVSPTGTNVIRAIRVVLGRAKVECQHITNRKTKSLNSRQYRGYCQWKVGYGEF
jgi:hypothetical protein